MQKENGVMIKKRDSDKDDPAPSSYFAMAKAAISLDEVGGRFADQRVVGSTKNAGSLYPASGVPNADTALEEPLGDDLRPGAVGTPAEVAASIARLERKEAE
jgi:hypothetical protein